MFEFDWDEANLQHIARHAVTRAEVEEVFTGPMVFIDTESEGGEIRFVEIGRTASGRVLKVVTTDRQDKIRVVTAFEPNAREANEYRREVSEQA